MDDTTGGAADGEAGDMVTVEMVGGPWDGHRQALVTRAQLAGPREDLGAWMLHDGPPPGEVPDGTDARAVYEPDPSPAPADVWHFRGWTYA